MNEQIQKQIAEILGQALSAAQKGGQWMAGQIPDILHQLLVWTIVKGISSAAIFLTILIVGYLSTTRWTNQELDYIGWWHPSKAISCVAWLVGSLVFFLIAVTCMTSALEAIFAPKLFLLEYAAQLIH